MSSKLFTGARVCGAIAVIALNSSTLTPADAANAKNQADVDAVKLSKDDNQHQVKSAKNTNKKGAPLPFEGPPGKSGMDTSGTSTTSTDRKP